jgi:hypothetical protein
MYGEVEVTDHDEVKACHDAYCLALFGGYYLRREPSATLGQPPTTTTAWRPRTRPYVNFP